MPNGYIGIQIEITIACNLLCWNCDRSCTQAPSNESMSVEQVEKFVNESLELDWKWENIGLIGGEPTLHPRLFDILEIFKKYRDVNPDCQIGVMTNGYGRKVNEVISRLPDWVYIDNSYKTSKINLHYTINVASIDLEEYKDADFTVGCGLPKRCGIGLNRYGYYACCPGANCDRVFGFDIGLKSLSDVNDEAFKKQRNILCRYCGYFKYKNLDKEAVAVGEIVYETRMSKTWEKVYGEYKKQKPLLHLY